MVLTCGDNASASSEKLDAPPGCLHFPSLQLHHRRGVIIQYYSCYRALADIAGYGEIHHCQINSYSGGTSLRNNSEARLSSNRRALRQS